VCNFFTAKCNRSRCQSRSRSLSISANQKRDSVVPSPSETQPYNNLTYYIKFERNIVLAQTVYVGCPNPLPVKHPITIHNGGIENLVYREFRSKVTPADACCSMRNVKKILDCYSKPWVVHVLCLLPLFAFYFLLN